MTTIKEIIDRFRPQQIVALTAWGEARGDGSRGMQAVLNVIMNRAAHPRWWGQDAVGVCLKPWQFSCWNANDPNLPKMLAVTPYNNLYREAYRLAGLALDGRLEDITVSADHYHSIHIRPPKWAADKLPTAFIQNHVFYRLEI